MNVALYIRVSSVEQRDHGYSIENQLEALQAYSSQHGYVIYKIYNDAGISGHVSYKKRPALLELISDCKQGKIDLILFTRIDRWFRSIKDYYLVQEQIGNIPWKAIWEDYETQTSSGQLKVNIMLSIGEAEATRTGERIKSVLDAKQEKGEVVYGVAPTGYIRQNKQLVKDPETQAGVQAFFAEYLTSKSISSAMAAAISRGVSLDRQAVRRMLRNPRYCQSAEPYITEQEFTLIQDTISHRTRQPAGGRVYLFSGLIICGYCGCRFAGTFNRDGRQSYVCYKRKQSKYDCRCRSMGEAKIEKFLLAEIKTEMDKQKIEPIETHRKSIDTEKEIAKLQARLDRIGIRFEDGDITVEEYRQKKADIKQQITDLQKTPESVSLALPETWEELYYGLSKIGKKSFWQGIVRKITMYNDRIEIVWR